MVEQTIGEFHPNAKVNLTTSGTHALELIARILDISDGDEVIVPNFAFVTVASAFAAQGAKIVFVDVDDVALNLDPHLTEQALSERTKAIVTINYGGAVKGLRELRDIADRYQISLIEDNAHAALFTASGNRRGTTGDYSVLSFHGTKNLSCGEGGALIANRDDDRHMIDLLIDKGTDRREFLEGRVDKYTWKTLGSSYALSDYLALILQSEIAFLPEIQQRREEVWQFYFQELSGWAQKNGVRFPPSGEIWSNSSHVFFLLMRDSEQRARFMSHLKEKGIGAVAHYQSLADSTAGRIYGTSHGPLLNSRRASDCLVRLPLYPSLTSYEVTEVVEAVLGFPKA